MWYFKKFNKNKLSIYLNTAAEIIIKPWTAWQKLLLLVECIILTKNESGKLYKRHLTKSFAAHARNLELVTERSGGAAQGWLYLWLEESRTRRCAALTRFLRPTSPVKLLLVSLPCQKGGVCAVLCVVLENVRIIFPRFPLLVYHANTIANVFLKTLHLKASFQLISAVWCLEGFFFATRH